GNVDLDEILLLVRAFLHLTRDADDLARCRITVRVHPKPDAERVPASEVPAHEALADDAHERSVGAVFRRERPARNDREIERAEVSVADDLKVRRRLVA